MGNVIYLSHRDAARAKVATEVRVEMARAGINESALAAATGISQSTMNRRLKPKVERDAFTVDELERVADVLGVPISAFFKTADHDDDDGGDDGGDDDGGTARNAPRPQEPNA